MEQQQQLGAAQQQRSSLAARLADILLHKDPELLELIPGACLVGWGLMVGSPLWDIFALTPAFAAMTSLAPYPWLWGLVAITFGAVQVAGLLLDHADARKLGSFLSFCGWLFLWILILLGEWRTPATVVYLVLALASAWGDLRLALKERGR